MKKADDKPLNKILWRFLKKKKKAQQTSWQAAQPSVNRQDG